MDERVVKIIDTLSHRYSNPKTELEYESVFQLLVAVILSAQCTDKRVNTVTPKLFEVAPDAFAMSALDIERLEEIIHSCGFFRNKAKNIKAMSQALVDRYDGKVPCTVEQLMSLAGVGRKTANVVYAFGFGGNAIAVDTHVFRVSHRLGLAKGKTPDETERELNGVIDPKLWSDAHHYLLFHGRYTCKSQKPLCNECDLAPICDKIGVKDSH